MRLADLPAGSRCFVDANIFYYHFVDMPGVSSECSAFVARVEAGEITAFSAQHVMSEAIHKVMVAEAVRRRSASRAGMVPWLRRHPAELATFDEFRAAAVELNRLPIKLLPPDAALLVEAADASTEAGLLTNHATSVALMRRHGLSDIASNDDDFGSVAGVALWRPR